MIKSRRQDSKVLSESRMVQLIWPFSWCRRPLSAPPGKITGKKITALNILGFFASERNARILLGPQRYHRHVPHALAPLSLFFYSACTTQHMGSQFPNQGWDGTHGPCIRSLVSHWEPPDKSYLSLSWTSIQQGHISGFSVLVASQYHTELIIFSLTDLKINPT